MTISVPALEADIAVYTTVAGGDVNTVATASNGRQIPSLTKMLTDSFQYKGPSIAWVPALDVTDTLQTYSESGVIYIPKPSAVPFTTGGSFAAEAANWLPLQGYVNASGADLDLAGGGINDGGVGSFTSVKSGKSAPMLTNKRMETFGGEVSMGVGNTDLTLFTRPTGSSTTGMVFVSLRAGSTEWGYIYYFYMSNNTFTATLLATGNSQSTTTPTLSLTGEDIVLNIAYAGGLGGTVNFAAHGHALAQS